MDFSKVGYGNRFLILLLVFSIISMGGAYIRYFYNYATTTTGLAVNFQRTMQISYLAPDVVKTDTGSGVQITSFQFDW